MFLTHVGFWDLKSEEPSAKYLGVLQRALDAGLKQLVVLLVPTSVRRAFAKKSVYISYEISEKTLGQFQAKPCSSRSCCWCPPE